MTLLSNTITVYTTSRLSAALKISGAWSTTENCDGTISGKLIKLTGAWSTTENCDGTVSGKLIKLTGAWSTTEGCN